MQSSLEISDRLILSRCGCDREGIEDASVGRARVAVVSDGVFGGGQFGWRKGDIVDNNKRTRRHSLFLTLNSLVLDIRQNWKPPRSM